MNFEQWETKYQPIQNTLNDNAAVDGRLFETYGNELKYVDLADPLKIWTFIDNGETLSITNGKQHVNRLGFFISALPYSEPTPFLDVLLFGKDEELYNIKDDEPCCWCNDGPNEEPCCWCGA